MKPKKGFTILEFIIIMAIMTTLSAVLVAIQQSEEKKMALGRSAFQLFQKVREVQEMAMSSQTTDCGGNPSYSFGIYFDSVSSPESYLIFADCNANGQKDSGDKEIKEISLEKGVEISSTSPTPLSIIFSPPNPTTFINGSSSGREAEIIFSLSSGGAARKKVKVNTAGRIQIE